MSTPTAASLLFSARFKVNGPGSLKTAAKQAVQGSIDAAAGSGAVALGAPAVPALTVGSMLATDGFAPGAMNNFAAAGLNVVSQKTLSEFVANHHILGMLGGLLGGSGGIAGAWAAVKHLNTRAGSEGKLLDPTPSESTVAPAPLPEPPAAEVKTPEIKLPEVKAPELQPAPVQPEPVLETAPPAALEETKGSPSDLPPA